MNFTEPMELLFQRILKLHDLNYLHVGIEPFKLSSCGYRTIYHIKLHNINMSKHKTYKDIKHDNENILSKLLKSL